MTHAELIDKYARAAEYIRSVVDHEVYEDWTRVGIDELAYTIYVDDDQTGYTWEVYDRMDYPLDREEFGLLGQSLWVIMHADRGFEITALTLEEALAGALARYWFAGNPDPAAEIPELQ